MAHFLAHQVFDDADLRDLVCSTYLDAADFPLSQFLTDAAQHDTQVIHFDNIGVMTKVSTN